MAEALCPWDAIETLEVHCGDRTFPARWRAFVLACGEAVLTGLPAEAREWAEAAAGFDRGERSAAELAALSSAAWAFHRGRAESDPWPVQSGLLVVMTGLGVGFDAHRWHEGAWHFLNACETAGVPDDVLTGLLRRHFGPLLPE
jgi:hypothetical protein